MAVTSLILPPATVTRTCTLPYWFCATTPVAVLAAVLLFDVVLDCALVVAFVVAVWGEVAGVSFCGWAWNDRTPATPATVADMTIGARRIRTRTPPRGSALAACRPRGRTPSLPR